MEILRRTQDGHRIGTVPMLGWTRKLDRVVHLCRTVAQSREGGRRTQLALSLVQGTDHMLSCSSHAREDYHYPLLQKSKLRAREDGACSRLAGENMAEPGSKLGSGRDQQLLSVVY